MADADDGQEKTEEPTAKRRQEAREEGRITTSTEVFVLVTMGMGALMLMAGQWALPGLADRWATGLIIDGVQSLDAMMYERMRTMMLWMLAAGPGLGLPLLATVLVAQSVMGGLNFAPKAIGFKPEKINPLTGLGRMASMKSLVDLGKAVLKVTLLLTAGILMLYPLLPALEGSAALSPGDAMVLFGTAMLRVLGGLLIGLVVIAALDLGWQIHSNTKSMRMSRQDIKDESKESEGSPEQKGAMRRRQMQASRRASERKALADVPLATAIITNPTHFAVALRYEPGADAAPRILAMGKGPMAQAVIRRGRRAGVTTLQVPPLARALYFTGAIGREIPDVLFAAVAVILAHVWRLEQGQPAPMPDVDLPPDLTLDEFGRPLKWRTQ
ncbi:EscU/YscU/HrcU family type III secretion system export apparatus switch protein [Roseovarius sp. BRH_c41]|jgi:flagellar biosynthetic protein FlhB|uniref:EscU/YscU/HrcU family type III secretion system export apparatus switch protein n=1 Tax=Roseovarius sp. BRH_c41 TaxID=1629709 RepID=UPI0005F0D38A|nr:EscU/YscU/HrcU family type III secretion system export apparatus switch protein [Roseovarius sp. BRH_c41]KJS44172.1 MAG: flagellar biosynthesis protein FlhB [Roseovarius sp. BRH_c41]